MKENKSLYRIAGEGTAWFSGRNFILKFLALGSAFIILRNLSVYEYGVVQLALSVFSVGSVFILSNLNEVIVADMGVLKKDSPEKMKAVFLSFFRLQLILSALAWAVLFFVPSLFERFVAEDVASFLRVVSFLFLAVPFRSAFSILSNVGFKFFAISAYVVVEESARFAFLLAAAFFLGLGVYSVLLAAVASQFLAILIMLPFSFDAYGPLKGIRYSKISIWNILLRHGKWALFTSYVSGLNKDLRKWLIKIFIGTEAVALYSLASSLIGHIRSLMPIEGIVSPIIPQYMRDRERLNRILGKSVKYQLLGYMAIGVAAFVFTPPFIGYFFPHYLPSLPLYNVMLFSLIPTGFAVIITPVFYALRRQRSLFFAYLVRLALTAVSLPVLAHYFGVMGVAYEFVLTLLAFVALRYWALLKILPDFKLSARDLFSLDEYDRIILGKMSGFIKRKIG